MAHSSLDEDTENWVKYYTEAATRAFLAHLVFTRQVSLNKAKPKALPNAVGTIFEGIGDVITGAQAADSGGGGALGKLAFLLVSELYQRWKHEEFKKLDKHLEEIDPEEPKLLEDLVKFFYGVFKDRNIQLHGILRKGGLKDSWQIAMEKLASESVLRIFDHMTNEAKKPNTSVSMGTLTEKLQNALRNGKGQPVGTSLKWAILQLKKEILDLLSKGRTIRLKNGVLNPDDLFNSPTEITDRNIKSLLDEELNDPYYFYAPDFSDTEHQACLAEKIRSEREITDLYKALDGRQDDMIKSLVEDLKPFSQKVLFQQLLDQGEGIKKMIEKEGYKNKCDIMHHITDQVSNSEVHSVVLIGGTGIGKSTVASWLAHSFDRGDKNPFKRSHDKTVATNDVHRATKPIAGGKLPGLENFRLHIGDTPGLGKTATDVYGNKMEDQDILIKITEHIKVHCSFESKGLSAFLLVLDSNGTVNVDHLRKYMRHFLPEKFVSNLIVILNHQADLEEKDDAALIELREEFTKILDQEYTVRPETKDAANSIEAIYFSELDIDKSNDQPSAEEVDMMDGELIKLVKLIREKGTSKYRVCNDPLTEY